MKQTFRTLLVASAVAASASLAAAGIDSRQQTQQPSSQSSQSSQSGQSGQSTQAPTPSPSQPSAQGRDEAGARQHLVQAKQALMDLTKLPEASQLQGEARNGVIQIINSFNALVTADTNWYDRYKEVQQQVARLLGNDVSASGAGSTSSGAEPGSTGTSGSAAGSADVPAPVRSKLLEFRQHLSAFGQAAGAPDNGAAAGTGSTAPSSSAQSGQSSTAGTSGATSASGSTSGQSATSGSQPSATATSGETFQQHFDAIADLVQQALGSSPAASSTYGSGTTGTTGTSGSATSSSTTAGSSASGSGQPGTSSSASSSTGTVPVDRATLEQIQSHLQRLRELARQRGIQ